MYITNNQVSEWKEVIDKLNALDDEKEKMDYLNDNIEDVDFFLKTLKSINKTKLVYKKKKKEIPQTEKKYTEDEVILIFENNKLEDIIKQYSKKELISMYLTFYSSRPVTSFDKKRIAQTIYNYIYSMKRTKTLLG
ncbi:MAG: hypothetical protein HFJ09_10480 [Lachnospiraceae bacterium]|nr:hypothetical protein [Lachnospiraceae bacterium]